MFMDTYESIVVWLNEAHVPELSAIVAVVVLVVAARNSSRFEFIAIANPMLIAFILLGVFLAGYLTSGASSGIWYEVTHGLRGGLAIVSVATIGVAIVDWHQTNKYLQQVAAEAEAQRINADALARFSSALELHESFHKPLIEIYSRHYNLLLAPPEKVADVLSRPTQHLPGSLIEYREESTLKWVQFVWPYGEHILGEMIMEVQKLPVALKLPSELRTEHMHIVAGSGQGKTQLIQGLVLDDLDNNCSIVVIDSQGDLVRKLATVVPEDRMILVDPEHCPPALNIFASKANTQQEIATAVDLYEYIFSSLDATMTSKQATLYRFVSRFMMVIPGATIHTMRELLEKGGLDRYRSHLEKLGTTPRAFFENEYDDARNYGDTRREVMRRLYTVLENDTLGRMLGAPTNKVDMQGSLDSGKIILVNTNKAYLKQTGSSLFGRIFISQVVQSVMNRPEGDRMRTYLYIDEAQDYAEDSHVLFNMFEQGRKYGLGLIWSHQYLDQLPMKLRSSISANTAIKFAGGVSASDAKTLAGQMRVDPDMIDRQEKGTFFASFRGLGSTAWPVQLGRLENLKRATPEELQAIYGRMMQRYGAPPQDRPRPAPPAEPDNQPPDQW